MGGDPPWPRVAGAYIFVSMTAPPDIPAYDGASVPAREPLLLDVVLYPHRSLSPKGFVVLMSAVTAVSFVAGIAFVSIGAWPVFGFFGLDVLLLAWCFRLNYRQARLYETVQVSRSELVVRRVHPDGKARRWSFQPFWLKVLVDDAPDPGSRLTLASHGRQLAIGSFLSPDERVDLARTISRALDEVRRAPGAEAGPAPSL